MEFLIGYVESPMDTLLHHQSRQLFRAVATALNRGMPFDGDPRKSLWEKWALEVAQEHCVNFLPVLTSREMQARPGLARNHCLSQ